MDISPEYIEMCLKAEDIQASWELKFGDYYWFQGKIEIALWLQSPGNIIRHAMHYQWELPRKKIDCIFLPRQDQLQDMVEGIVITTFGLLQYFYKWNENSVRYKNSEMKRWSMEQLWLSFVMYEKYGKKWNGEDWNHS